MRSLFELEQDHDLVLGASLAVAGGAFMPIPGLLIDAHSWPAH